MMIPTTATHATSRSALKTWIVDRLIAIPSLSLQWLLAWVVRLIWPGFCQS